jgi:hypothetical protein
MRALVSRKASPKMKKGTDSARTLMAPMKREREGVTEGAESLTAPS